MNIRLNRAALVGCLAFAGASALPLTAGAQGSGDITPSHVYQATSDLIAEIEILRDGACQELRV